METKKEIYRYLQSVKQSLGYIPSGYIVNAYNVKVNVDNICKNVKSCTNATYEALKSKKIWNYK